MHPADIKAALEKAGFSQAAVAKQCQVSKTTVGYVIKGKGRSASIERRIALITKLPLRVLWPKWYDAQPSRSSGGGAAPMAAAG